MKNNTTTKKCMGSRIKRLLLSVSFLLAGAFIFAQERSINGTLTDNTGVALPGVNIYVKGTTTGTVSDINGKYQIKVPSSEAILVFKYVGYATQEITVGEQTAITVTLNEDLQQLNEVVVVGYGVQKKKLVTGATLNMSGDDIQSLKTSSPMEALKGISPGVSITQNNGVPGSGTKVTIRGIGTIGDAKPLYIVDGLSVGDIDFLSPSDIESIDVLKDAASAAIYGSRAANGVILVTTKKGRKDSKVEITYDGYMGVQNVYKKPELLNAQQYVEIIKEAYANSNQSKILDWANDVPNWADVESGKWTGTNWFEAIENKDAMVRSHSVGVTGGSEKSIYSLGGSYYEEEGILGKQINSTYKRLSLRLNTENVLIEKNGLNILTLGENLNYSNTKKPTFRTGNIYWNDLHNMMVTSPLLPMWAQDNNGVDSVGTYHYAIPMNDREANPVAIMEREGKYNSNDNNNIVGNAYLEIQPIKNLKVRSSYGINAWFGNSRKYIPAYNLSSIESKPVDQVSQGMYSGSTWTWTNTASYSATLGDHNFTALAGNEMQKNTSSLSLDVKNENNIFHDWEHAYISNTNVITNATTISGQDKYGWGMLSYFGRLSYDYKETYMLTLVLRADGSSNFPIGHRWGTFPSVSAGWVISNESFMEPTKTWLSTLKLRGSWGQNGNQSISQFQYMSSQSYELSNYFFGPDKSVRTVGSSPARVPNFDLSWETSEQTNVGVDMNMFNNKLQFTFDMYEKDTRDWLIQPDQPALWGTSSAYVNGGFISNKGIEMVVRWNSNVGELKYGASASIAYNKNKVEEIKNKEKIFHGATNLLSQGTSEYYRAQEGFPVGYFWGFKTNGILQDSTDVANYVAPNGKPYNSTAKPGDIRFVDTNNDSVLNEKDKVMIGDPNPDYIVGFQVNAEYKGFYIMATANGSYGMQVAKSYRSFLDSPQQNYTTDVYDRWHGKGTSNKMPRLESSPGANWKNLSDIFLEDADFLRISNITIGYDLKYLFKRMPFAETKLYISVKNLHTFTNYSGLDPEVGYAPDSWASGVDLGLYPSSQSYMVGLNLKF